MNSVTGAPVGSISLPESPVAIAAPGPGQSRPGIHCVKRRSLLSRSQHAAFSAAGTARPVYPPGNQPPVSGESFKSIAVAPDGSMVYLGGAQQECIVITSEGPCSSTPTVNAIFAISTNSIGPCQTPDVQGCTWVAPYTPIAESIDDTDFYGSISGLALTPNGQDLFAVNDPAAKELFCGPSFAYGFRLTVPTSMPPTGPFPVSGNLGVLVERQDGQTLEESLEVIRPAQLRSARTEKTFTSGVTPLVAMMTRRG